MKCISLWQPWATLWAGGAKVIETRHWPLRLMFPCDLAVHAAKRFPPDLAAIARMDPFAQALAKLGIDEPGQLPLGGVVGVVRVVRVYQFQRGVPLPPYPECAFGDYEPGRWGWVAEDARLLATPIPLRGQQGIWNWVPPAPLSFADGNGPRVVREAEAGLFDREADHG